MLWNFDSYYFVLSNNNSNSTNLGFNVTGGYESDIPATIFNIKKELLIKVTTYKSNKNLYF